MSDLTDGKKADWPTGKPLVVNFWASWCAPCRKEMPAFEQVHQRLGDRVTIIGVTDDPKLDKARDAAKVSKVTYPLFIDDDHRLLSDLKITGLPATIFVDADGKIIARHRGVYTAESLTKEIEKRYGTT